MRYSFFALWRKLALLSLMALLCSPARTFAITPVFINSGASLPGASIGSVAWGDFNNDGRLDILLAGNSANGYISEVLSNKGGVAFSNINAAFSGLDKCSVAWGDYDNDGNLDILISGMNSGLLPDTEIWHNQGNGTFVNANISLKSLSQSSAVWADLAGDGYLDVIITGLNTNGNRLSQVWHNLGGFNFTNVPVSFTPLSSSSVAVGDFNNDGFPDILLTGNNGSGPVTELWQNNGNLTFTKITNSLTPVYSGAAVWGDFDNDGVPDVLIVGSAGGTSYLCQVFKGLGNGAFTNMNIGAAGLSLASAAWGDFDNDGRLDFLVEGYNAGYVTQLWDNNTANTNTPPAAPSGLAASVTANGVVLSWNAASDAQTPASGLSYNIRVGTNSGGISVVSPAANLTTGFRRLPQMGNAQERLFSILNLPPGTYFWSVQSVDSAFAGSPFAPESTFVMDAIVTTTPASSIGLTAALLNGTVNPLGLDTEAWFRWGTTTNYGNTTTPQYIGNATTTLAFNAALLSLEPGTTYHYSLVATDSVGVAFGADQSFATLGGSPPSISPLANVNADAGVATSPIPITLSDASFPPSNLLVTAVSSSSSLIPAANLVLGGSGANRTLTITPAAGQTGSAVITVSASDGVNTVSQSFIINVGLVPGDVDGVGYIDQNDFNLVLSNYWLHACVTMTNPVALNGGLFLFTLTNAFAPNFTVLVSTDLANWSVLPAKAVPVFQFVDPQVIYITNTPCRFYQLRWP